MDQAALVAQFPAATADAPPPPAANASPSAAVPPPSHPSYAEMITAAIVWGSSQGKEGGSSKRAIAKYIDRVYTNLPPSHSALLTHHLKRLKNSGHLVMIKNSYQLSSAMPIPPPSPPSRSAPSAAPPPHAVSPAPSPAVAVSPAPANPSLKRGPGRPPKQKPETDTATQPTPISSSLVVDNGSGFGSESGKKRRGRPPKQPQQRGDVAAEVPFVQPISEIPPKLVNGEATSVGQKTRGRPPKQQQAPVEPPVAPFAQPVVQVSEEVVVANVPKRRPGRPPKGNVVGSETPVVNVAGSEMSTGGVTVPRSRGRPRKNALGPVSRTIGKKPRGRPRKLGVAVGMRMGMVPGKRRGRPPKGAGGGGPPKLMTRTGRRVGRPRKDASAVRNQTSDREGIANEELMTKFQLIQSKIREAVAIIRPCVGNEDAALMALQELEELAIVNLTVTSMEEAPPSPTTMQQRVNCPPTPAVPLSVVAPGSSPQPTVTETSPFTGAPMSFDITGPPMNVSAPFHAPAGMESEHANPMSWFQSNEAES